MSKKQSFPPLDFYAIEFPSDKVTLGEARKIDHYHNGMGVFSSTHDLGKARATDVLSLIPLSYEMEVAEIAYAKALGISDPRSASRRAELIGLLRDQWKQDCISSGSQQSTQFIRDIEQAAMHQAERHLGKGL